MLEDHEPQGVGRHRKTTVGMTTAPRFVSLRYVTFRDCLVKGIGEENSLVNFPTISVVLGILQTRRTKLILSECSENELSIDKFKIVEYGDNHGGDRGRMNYAGPQPCEESIKQQPEPSVLETDHTAC